MQVIITRLCSPPSPTLLRVPERWRVQHSAWYRARRHTVKLAEYMSKWAIVSSSEPAYEGTSE